METVASLGLVVSQCEQSGGHGLMGFSMTAHVSDPWEV